ncbi:hypothetical protein [Orenia marismortui]|uniref:hypothetical protein n=1 Tax=Orenia marismortui TaxID=46469 RepID=UPI000370CEEE|nr:hypothetical protein [Orenia marismortui]
MSRRFSIILRNCVEFIERLILIIIVGGFVMLVAAQLILSNPKLKDSLIARIPKVNSILTFGQSKDFQEPAKAVFSTKQDRDYLVIALQNKSVENNAKLMMNGQIISDFSRGYVKVDIDEGDYLAIDTRGVEEGLWFEITGMSTSISSFRMGQQFWVRNGLKSLGKVEGINKF